MPKTSTNTPCIVVLGAKISERIRNTLPENSLELRLVTRTGQPVFSATSAKLAEGKSELVKMQQGTS